MMTFRSKELSIFYEKLAQLYKAGVPIMESLPLASVEVKDSGLKRGVAYAHEHVLHGHTLTEGFSQCPDVFTDIQIALIAVGEKQGRLDETLINLSSIYERKYKDIRNFLFALLYPAFLLLAAIFLPPIVTWFTDGLEAYVKMVVSSFFRILFPIAVIYLIYYLIKTYLPDTLDRVKLAIPVLGSNLKKLALARFSRSLAILFASGVEIRTSLKLSIGALGNNYLEQRCRVVHTAIDDGATLTQSLQTTNIFPQNLIQMISVGERTGELDKMLDKAAQYYEYEADKVLKVLMAAIPVVIYLGVAAYIAYIVISFYAGYYSAIGDMLK
jgi:type II secretory pathway component PulF